MIRILVLVLLSFAIAAMLAVLDSTVQPMSWGAAGILTATGVLLGLGLPKVGAKSANTALAILFVGVLCTLVYSVLTRNLQWLVILLLLPWLLFIAMSPADLAPRVEHGS